MVRLQAGRILFGCMSWLKVIKDLKL